MTVNTTVVPVTTYDNENSIQYIQCLLSVDKYFDICAQKQWNA